MKTINSYKKLFHAGVLSIFVLSNILFVQPVSAGSTKVIYPLKEISKLECRFRDFKDLDSDCKEQLPVLKTKDYKKYIDQDGGYNKFTRLYTVLWGSSYKYGWDVGNGGHIGTDIATSKGTPVYVIADGTVLHAKEMVALGNAVTVEHMINGKKVISNYAHLSSINVTKGQKIKVGKKIGEVGSTGNSTGNHLHFQIDLQTPFHPYYYDYSSCPYSYYKISETGVCFDELQKYTIDPMLFLETNGGILDSIQLVESPSKSSLSSGNGNSFDSTIFDRTVYVGYGESDIKKVQQIFKDIGEYNGPISGDYYDIEEYIINYQISNKIVADKNGLGAGWFGPKTRSQVKKDYDNFIANGGKSGIAPVATVSNSNVKTEKISRQNILSREEIEEREAKEFIKDYKINLHFKEVGGNIEKNKTSTLKLTIENRGGKPFKGSMPGGMTFSFDESKVTVFPQKLYYFTDGKRDIKITGLQSGNTTLYVKVGKTTVESIPLKVFASGETIYPESSKIYSSKSIVLGDIKTGIGLFKDSKGKKLINLKYGSTFKLQSSDGIQVCIKRGNINNIKRIYTSKCNDSDYKDSINFTYADTVGGLLIFDYKAVGRNAKFDIINTYNNKILSSKSLSVSNPKGLKSNYAYKNEVIKMLESGVVDGINKGQFLENRELTQADALKWIENALLLMKTHSTQSEKNKINESLTEIASLKYKVSKFDGITREGLLNLSHKYLVLNKSDVVVRNYIDLNSTQNTKVNTIFDGTTTWKDQFGENYFRPDVKVTRGEGSYMLAIALEKNQTVYLTSR